MCINSKVFLFYIQICNYKLYFSYYLFCRYRPENESTNHLNIDLQHEKKSIRKETCNIFKTVFNLNRNKRADNHTSAIVNWSITGFCKFF